MNGAPAARALAHDNAFGQPLESQLRSCLLATWMCEAAGFQGEVRDTGKQVIAGRSGHHIHIDQPELVVDVIREVVAKARK